MSTVFARLVAKMGWDSNAADQGLNNFQSRVAGAGSAMSANLRNAIIGGLSGAAILGAGKALFDSLLTEGEDAIRILRESINTGLTPEAFQAMEKTLKRINLEADDLKGFIFSLTERLQDAVTGANLESRGLFESVLGMSPEFLASLDTTEKQIIAIGEAIRSVDNTSEFLRAGTILFGGDFEKLNAAFRNGFLELFKFNKQSVVATSQLEKLAAGNMEFNETLAELRVTWKGIIADLGPGLRIVSEMVAQIAKGIRNSSNIDQAFAAIITAPEKAARRYIWRAITGGLGLKSNTSLTGVENGTTDLLGMLNSALEQPGAAGAAGAGNAVGASSSFTANRSFDIYAQRGLFLSSANQRTEQQRFQRDLFQEIEGVKREVARVSKTIETEVGGV